MLFLPQKTLQKILTNLNTPTSILTWTLKYHLCLWQFNFSLMTFSVPFNGAQTAPIVKGHASAL